MTKEQLVEELMRLKVGDTEINHSRADDLLVDYINDPEIAAAYFAIEKWYA